MAIQMTSNSSSSLTLQDPKAVNSFLEWMESLPEQSLSGPLALAMVIQQEIEPIIREKKPECVLEGDVLSPDIVQSKGFQNQLEIFSKKIPLFQSHMLPFFNGTQGPLKELIKIVQEKTTITNNIEQFVLFCRRPEQKTAFKEGLALLSEKIHQIVAINGSFVIECQALIGDSKFSFPLAIEGKKETTPSNEIQEVFDLVPKDVPSHDCSLFNWKFEHGKCVSTSHQMSFESQNNLIEGTLSTKETNVTFVDLREEGEDWFNE